jgi:hypothetical protein
MALLTTDISDILNHLNLSVDAMHRSMQEMCDPELHHTRISKLQKECERTIFALRNQHETTTKRAEEARWAKQSEIAEKRKKEEEVIAARRRKEDEERGKRIEEEEILREKEIREEDERTEKEKVDNERRVTTNAQEQINRLEGEIRKRWEEGRVKVRVLDDKRKVR